ncbi:hypothetical protein PINS_up009927 [Pythium insidiosum]|nr:hypothetical protein PINS_up009927 [Pythium insidiosum]
MRGRDVFVDQTRRFAVLFGHFEQRLQQLQHVEATNGNALLLASVRLDLTITDATLHFIFPHIRRNELIARKLLGARVSCVVSAGFEFDDSSRIVRADWNIDFVGAFLQLLTLAETTALFQQAQIMNDAVLVVDSEPHPQSYSSDDDAMWRRRQSQQLLDAEHTDAIDKQFWWREELCDGEGELLLHDGLGDDFVMV